MSTSLPGPPENELLNIVVRMVVPMRREFGRHLDVRQFMRDGHYAHDVLDQALGSRDPRLLEYARVVAQRLGGPRHADPPASPARGPAPTPATSAMSATPATPTTSADPSPAVADDAAALRERILRKYTGGLR